MSLRADTEAGWLRVRPAALLTLALMLALGFLMALAPDGVTVATLQPADGSFDVGTWSRVGEAKPAWAVTFFIGDTLYALALAWAFLRLRRSLAGGPLAAIALGAAMAKAGADVLENLLYLWPAAQALAGEVTSWPPIGALTSLAMLKRAAGAVTGVAFAFALGGESVAARLGRLLLAALGLAAALGFVFPALALAHASLVFLFFAFLVWYAPRAADDY
jgi:hypothetical protein